MGVFNDMQQAVDHAKAVDYAVNDNVRGMVKLCQGRLQKAFGKDSQAMHWDIETLKALKRELRDFDMTTGKWKDPK